MRLSEEDREQFLHATLGLWDSLRGKHLLITGGTGFFGKWLLSGLIWANEEYSLGATAHVLTRNPDAFARAVPEIANHGSIALLKGDILSFEDPQADIDSIIHAATDVASGALGDPLRVLQTNINGTWRVLELARRHRVRRLLLTSSGAVYGPQPPSLSHVPEDHDGAPNPLSLDASYGEAKRVAEHLCILYHETYGVDVSIARCFAFLGPYLSLEAHFAAGNFIRDALAGGPIRIRGDGTDRRSYLYACDLSAWLWTILLRGSPGRVYNVGSDDDLSIAELAAAISREFDPSPSVVVETALATGAPRSAYVPSILRARTELGLRSQTNLEQAIRRTVAFHRSTGS